MKRLKRASSVLAVTAGLAAVWACTDRSDPTGIRPGPKPTGEGPGAPIQFIAVECTANVKARTVSCPAPAAAQGAENALVVGGQNVYVTLASRNPDYDGTAFTFDVNVRNLIPQPLGTADGVTLDPEGVRVFFHTGPTVTAGTGEITVVGDGTVDLTGSAQPFYQYNQVLHQFSLSAWKTWRLEMPPSVESFSFLLYVSAAVRYPDGYVDVLGNPNVRSAADRQLTAVVRTAVGNVDSTATVTWSTADPHYAVVDSWSGMVHGMRAGSVTITATTLDGPARSGWITLNVTPITRTWTAAENSDWSNGNNWMPDSIVPVPTDTAFIPADMATYPVLTQNATVGTIQMDGNSTIQLGPFNLTATGSVSMPQFTTAAITSSSGRLELSGAARTVNGRVPRLFVTGTYSLTGNLTVERRIDVQTGRLTNQSFRIQQNP